MKVKKILALALSVSMLAGMSISSFADSGLTIGSSKETSSEESGLFIESYAVPSSAEEYAKGFFQDLGAADLEAMELDAEIENLHLSHGFTVTDMSQNSPDDQYCFPVLENDTVIAMMIVSYNNGKYGLQLGSSDFSENMNTLNTDSQNPATIFVSENAYYSIDKNGINVLETTPEVPESVLENEQEQLSYAPFSLNNDATEIINVSQATAYDISPNLVSTFAYTDVRYPVAIARNKTIDEKGICWAACTGSLIDYYEDKKASQSHAENLRDEIYKKQKANTGSVSGGASDAKKYIKEYCGLTLSLKGDLTWEQVRKQIRPVYTSWRPTNEKVGHAMVLEGNRRSTVNDNYHGIYLMDPNKTSKQLLTYGSAYRISGTNYYWDGTVTDKY